MKSLSEPVIVYCPTCGRRVAYYDGRTTMDISGICEKCRKRVVYHVDTGKAEIKPIPARTTSSGMTFR